MLRDIKNNRLKRISSLLKLHYLIPGRDSLNSAGPFKGFILTSCIFGSGYSSHISGAVVQEVNKNASLTCVMFVRGMRAALNVSLPVSTKALRRC